MKPISMTARSEEERRGPCARPDFSRRESTWGFAVFSLTVMVMFDDIVGLTLRKAGRAGRSWVRGEDAFHIEGLLGEVQDQAMLAADSAEV